MSLWPWRRISQTGIWKAKTDAHVEGTEVLALGITWPWHECPIHIVSARINCFQTGTMAHAFIAIRSSCSNFGRTCLLLCSTRAMDVMTAVITA